MRHYVILLLLISLLNQSVAEVRDDIDLGFSSDTKTESKCHDNTRLLWVGQEKAFLPKEFCTICDLSKTRSTRSTSVVCDAQMTTSLALVPYDETKVLPHELSSRTFVIAGHQFVIQQDWQQLGVAAVVWDSAVVLAEYLYKHKDLVKDKKVLELGAGTGLTGLVAAAFGANVTVTERAEALAHLNASIQSNTKGTSWKIRPQLLDWTSKVDPEIFQEFQVILGADIVYIEETFQDLLRTISSLATDENVLVLLSCRLRYDRDLRFLKMLEVSYNVNEIYFDSEKKIKIFSARKHS